MANGFQQYRQSILGNQPQQAGTSPQTAFSQYRQSVISAPRRQAIESPFTEPVKKAEEPGIFQKAKEKTQYAFRDFSLKGLKDALVGGLKTVPGQVKTATGIIADNYAKTVQAMNKFYTTRIGSAIFPVQSGFVKASEKAGVDVNAPVKALEPKAQKLREEGAKEQLKAREEYAQGREPTEGIQKYLEMAVFNVPQMMTTTGLSIGTLIVTRNPVLASSVGISTAYGLGASEVYTDAKEFGLEDNQAMPLATVGGLIIGALDFLPLDNLLKNTNTAKQVQKSVMKKISQQVVRIGVQSGYEGITESAQEIVGNAIQKTYDENQDLFEGALDAGIVGAMLGGVADVTTQTFSTIIGNPNKADQAIEEAINTPAEKRTEEQQQIVDIVSQTELTPDQALTYVTENKLGKSTLGKQIVKLALEARNSESNIRIFPSDDGNSLIAELVDKTAKLEKAVTEKVEPVAKPEEKPTEKVETEPIKEEKPKAMTPEERRAEYDSYKPVLEKILGKEPTTKELTEFVVNVRDSLESIRELAKTAKNEAEFVSNQIFATSTPGNLKSFIQNKYPAKTFADSLSKFYNENREKPTPKAGEKKAKVGRKEVKKQEKTPKKQVQEAKKKAKTENTVDQKIADFVDSKGVKFRQLPSLEQQRLTTRFMQHPDVASRKNGSYSFLTNLLKSKSLPIKESERMITQGVLDKHFKGQKNINMGDFRRIVAGEMMPLDIIETSTHAPYGSSEVNLGSAKTTTYLLNSPYKHGRYGHFPKDFRLDIKQDDVEIREIPPQPQNPTAKFAVLKKGVKLTEQNIEENVYTVAETKLQAQKWINEHSQEYAGRIIIPQESGLFAHFRAFDKGQTSHIAEIQSDVFQREYNERVKAENAIKYSQGQLKKLEQKLASEEAELKKGDESIFENTKQNIESTKADIKAKKELIAQQEKELADMPPPSKEESQFATYRGIWHERTVREAINIKANEGFKKVRFPTARTVALVEGFLNEDGEYMPYEIVSGDESGLEPGDTIDYGGEEMTVVNVEGEQIIVAPSDKVISFLDSEAREDDFNARWSDATYELEKLEEDFGKIDSSEKAQRVIDAFEVGERYVKWLNREERAKRVLKELETSQIITSSKEAIKTLEGILEQDKDKLKQIKKLNASLFKKFGETLNISNDLQTLEKAQGMGIDPSTLDRLAYFYKWLPSGNSNDNPTLTQVKKLATEKTYDEIKRSEERIAEQEQRILAEEKEIRTKANDEKMRLKPKAKELKLIPKKFLEKNTGEYAYSLDYEAEKILSDMIDLDQENISFDDVEDGVRESFFDGYEPDYEGMYAKVFYEEVGYDTKVWAVQEGHTEALGQPDTYDERDIDPENFNIEDYNSEQQTVMLFYEKQVNKYLKKLRKNNLELITDENDNQWYETTITEEDKQPPTAYRIKEDLADAGIKITDEQEKAILKLNKKLFGDDSVKITSQILANGKALGAYSEAFIKILDKQGDPTDTYLHEAVHKYLDLFTTREEHINILKEAYKRYQSDDIALLEEKIAEDFIDYANSRMGVSGTIKVMFDKLINRIKAYLKNADLVDSMYADLLAGKAKKKKKLKMVESEVGKANRQKVDEVSMEMFGRSLKDANKSQIFTAMQQAKNYIPFDEVIFKRGSQPQTPTSYVSQLEVRPALLYGGVKRHVFTDGYILALGKKMADAINLKNMQADIKRGVKDFQKYGQSYQEALKSSTKRNKESIANTSPKGEIEYVKYEDVIPKVRGNRAIEQGMFAIEKSLGVIYSDGTHQSVFDANLVAQFKKYYPNMQIRIQPGGLKPAMVYDQGKMVGVIMPIRTTPDVNFPSPTEFIYDTDAEVLVKKNKALQLKVRDAIFNEKSETTVREIVKEHLNLTESPNRTILLKTLKAELKRSMYDLAKAKTYEEFTQNRHDTSISKQINEIEEAIHDIDEVTSQSPVVKDGLANAGSQGIDTFEARPAPKKGSDEFKMFKSTHELVKKYAERIGEGYLPKGTLGVYLKRTKNIFVNSLNNLSTVAHEITHFLDYAFNISDKLMAIKGYATNGNPIYDSATLPYRKEMTKLYTKYYPLGKATHKLRKRTLEGFATLLQKYTETPTLIEKEFPLLVKDFLKPGGKFYQPVMGDIIADLNAIIVKYQGLSSIEKIGTRVTNEEAIFDKRSFLNTEDVIREEIADDINPWEVLAKKAGVGMSKEDPSLWLRSYRAINGIIGNNISTNKGFLSLRNGEFKKVHDFNWKTLVDLTQKRKNSDQFGYYLVARREYFAFQELDVLAEKVEAYKKMFVGKSKEEALEMMDSINASTGLTLREEIKQATTEYKELESVLKKDKFDREVVADTYLKNKSRFEEETKMFDALTRADMDMLHGEDVQIVSDSEYERLTSEQGYASFKRKFYNEILGDYNELPQNIRVGRNKISSYIRREGSEKPIINPLVSAIKNHNEVMRKGTRQVVYNKIAEIASSSVMPEIFQPVELKSYKDDFTGAIMYPQDKDPTILMGRMGGRRYPVLMDAKLKTMLDDLLTYQNIGFFQQIFNATARRFVQGTTGFFPPFAVANIIVDQITAMANHQNKFIPIYSPLKTLATAVKGKFGVDSAEYRYLQEYLSLGGERQTIVGMNEMTGTDLFNAISKEKNAILKTVDAILNGVSFLPKWSEIATRASEYIEARKAGKDQIVALEEAGRITAPFHHKGKWGGRAGKAYLTGLPYFNAQIQVLDQHLRQLKTKPGRKQMGVVYMAITASYLASILAMLRADDEQKEQYKDLEAKELTNYIYFPDPRGKNLLRFRMSPVFSQLGTAINMIIANKVMQAGYKASDFASMTTAWLPDQFNVLEPVNAFISWLPQFFTPGLEAVMNKRTYPKIKNLESIGQQNLPSGLRVNKNTSAFAKWLGEKLNFSPIKIDHLLTGYLGRATGYLTLKPSVLNFGSTIVREYWFSYGRRVNGTYELREKNDQNYKAYQDGKTELSEDDVRELYRVKVLTDDFYDLMGEWRDIDEEKHPEESNAKREEILDVIEMIESGEEPKGLNKWIRGAEKRRRDNIKEQKKNDLSFVQKVMKKIVPQAYALEEGEQVQKLPATGDERRMWYQTALKFRDQDPEWYARNVGEKGELLMFGFTLTNWTKDGKVPSNKPDRVDYSGVPFRNEAVTQVKDYQDTVDIIHKWADEYGVARDLAVDIAFAESTLQHSNPNKARQSSADGLFQWLDASWQQMKDWGVIPSDAKKSDPNANAKSAMYAISKGFLNWWNESKDVETWSGTNKNAWGQFYTDAELAQYYR